MAIHNPRPALAVHDELRVFVKRTEVFQVLRSVRAGVRQLERRLWNLILGQLGIFFVELREMKDDREKAFVEATNLLERYADLAGIYNIGAGNQGIARALSDKKRAGSVVFVGHEATEGNKALLLDGTLDAVIDQNPRVEAREALNILARSARGLDYDYHAPRLQIVFKENIPEI